MLYRAIRRAILSSIVAAYALAYSYPALAQTLNDPKLHFRELTPGLSQPTAMAFIGPGDILVLQKGNGRVRRVINGMLQPGDVLDVAVDNASERGLLGIAIHPSFPSTPFVYLYYTQSSNSGDSSGSPLANRVYRYTWNGSALVSPSLILDLPVTPGPNHNGGTMTFGPDGKLYIVIGDLNRDGQLQNFSTGPAPDNTGVIFRVNDDGSAPVTTLFSLKEGILRSTMPTEFETVLAWPLIQSPVNFGTARTAPTVTMRSTSSCQDSTVDGSRSWDQTAVTHKALEI